MYAGLVALLWAMVEGVRRWRVDLLAYFDELRDASGVTGAFLANAVRVVTRRPRSSAYYILFTIHIAFLMLPA